MEPKRFIGTSSLHGWFVAAISGAVVAGFLAGMEPTHSRAVLCVVIALGIVLASFLDEFIGLIFAIGLAAALVVIKQAIGEWGTSSFPHAVALSIAGFLSAWAISIAGTRMRKATLARRGAAAPGPSAFPPDALGLDGPGTARDRIAAEHARATFHDRPLALLAIVIEPRDGIRPELAALARAREDLARLLANTCSPADLPFRLDEARFGAILVESDPIAAYEQVATIVDALRHATVTLGDGLERRSVADYLDIGFGVSFREDHGSPDEFLAFALETADSAVMRGDAP